MKHAEAEYLDRLTSLGCIVCRQYAEIMGQDFEPDKTSTLVHHLRFDTGGANRASNYLTMPLCQMDHAGRHGVHGDKQRIGFLKLTEIGLLAIVIELVAETYT